MVNLAVKSSDYYRDSEALAVKYSKKAGLMGSPAYA